MSKRVLALLHIQQKTNCLQISLFTLYWTILSTILVWLKTLLTKISKHALNSQRLDKKIHCMFISFVSLVKVYNKDTTLWKGSHRIFLSKQDMFIWFVYLVKVNNKDTTLWKGSHRIFLEASGSSWLKTIE